MGLFHYSGIDSAEEAMDRLIDEIQKKGGNGNIDIQLVGGSAFEDENVGSLEMETDLLSLSKNYNISAVRLHVSQGADENDCPNSVNLVMTPEKTYYGPNLSY